MAETTAPLITDEDVDAACIAATAKLAEGLPVAGFRAALDAVAPRLRARWVAEERQQLAALIEENTDTLISFAGGKTQLLGLLAHMLRLDRPARFPDLLSLAEYRDGKR